MIFSESGLKTVSPYLLSHKSTTIKNRFLEIAELENFEKLLRKHHKVTYQTKNEIQKTIKEYYSYLCSEAEGKVCHPTDL